jgi:hypothetical protein
MATAKELTEAASLVGARSYQVRAGRFGIERIRDIARENGRTNDPRPGRSES